MVKYIFLPCFSCWSQPIGWSAVIRSPGINKFRSIFLGAVFLFRVKTFQVIRYNGWKDKVYIWKMFHISGVVTVKVSYADHTCMAGPSFFAQSSTPEPEKTVPPLWIATMSLSFSFWSLQTLVKGHNMSFLINFSTQSIFTTFPVFASTAQGTETGSQIQV